MPFAEEESLAIESYFGNLKGGNMMYAFRIDFCGARGVGKGCIQSRVSRQRYLFSYSLSSPHHSTSSTDRNNYSQKLCTGFYDEMHRSYPNSGTDRKQFKHRGKLVEIECELVDNDDLDHADTKRFRERQARDTEAFVLLYDVTNRASFEVAVKFHKMIRRLQAPAEEEEEEEDEAENEKHAFIPQSTTSLPPMPWKPVVVVATKIDTPKSTWAVKRREGKRFSERIGAEFLEVSAKTGVGLGFAFFGPIVDGMGLARMINDGKVKIRHQQRVGFVSALVLKLRRWFGDW
jgi:GTPase SAR1 family protein